MKPSGAIFLEQMQTWRLGVEVKQQARKPRGCPGDRGEPPLGRALHPRGLIGCFLTSTPSLLDCVCSKKIAPEGFIPFGIRLIFLFFETLK